MEHRNEKILLVVLIVLLFVVNYGFINNLLIKEFGNQEFVEVERVIDGDTVVVNQSSVRLLGINSPESGEYYFSEAKSFLEELILNRSLRIERYGKDLYDRELVYLFDGKKNINLEIVEQGFGNYYFPEGREKYYNEFVSAWEECVDKNINLCEKSLDKCVDCVVLEELNVEEQRVILKNVCEFDCELSGWSVKDEGRKEFVFENFVLRSGKEVEITAKDFNRDYVWTETGDTLFLRDSEGKLVLWRAY